MIHRAIPPARSIAALIGAIATVLILSASVARQDSAMERVRDDAFRVGRTLVEFKRYADGEIPDLADYITNLDEQLARIQNMQTDLIIYLDALRQQ